MPLLLNNQKDEELFFPKQRCMFFSILITFYYLPVIGSEIRLFFISWTSLSPVSVKIANYFANSKALSGQGIVLKKGFQNFLLYFYHSAPYVLLTWNSSANSRPEGNQFVVSPLRS